MNGRYLLVASVISVQNSTFVYPSCQNCFSKLLLDSKRYSCFKCGSSGDPKEADYRYRLSLEVADTQGVSEVTVFGSCLDVYFGVTAKDLQRYIEELNQETGEPDQGATPSVVSQAVETCFIGKKFVFAVKGFDRPKGNGSLQSNCPTDRYPKALIACQMLAPNPELVGYTVIHYLQQHRGSSSKLGHVGLWPPDLFEVSDEPSRELSSLQYSRDLNAVPSRPAEALSNFWPQSFRLTCSSTSSGTVADLADLDSTTAACNKQNWEGDPVSLPSYTACNVEGHKLTVTKRNNEEEEKKCPLRDRVENESESDSSLGKDCSLAQPLLKLTKRGSFCKALVPHSYGLQPSGNLFFCSSPLASPSSCARADEDSREDPGLWDELPSSESLNEFVARIENTTTTVLPLKADAGKQFPRSGAGAFYGKPPPEPGMFSASLKTRGPEEALRNLAATVEQGREGLLSCHQASSLPYRSDKSGQEAFRSSSSTEGDKERGCFSSRQPILLPPCSAAGLELSHSTGGCSLPTERLRQDVGLVNHHAGCTSTPTDNRLDDSWLPTEKITTRLSGPDRGHLPHGGGREGPSCQPRQTMDVAGIQGEGFEPANGEKASEVTGGKSGPLSPADAYRLDLKQGGLLQDHPEGPEDSYNASADLFDSNGEADATGRRRDSVHVLLAQAGRPECSGTQRGLRSGSTPRAQGARRNTSRHGLSPCDTFAVPDPKTSTPVSGLTSRSELSLLGSLDFVLPSPSTPLARPARQVSPLRGKELPVNKPPQSNARWKRFRPPSQNPLVKQLVGKFLKSQGLNPAGSRLPEASAAHPSLLHSSPLREVPGNAGDDWIPPSRGKGMPASLAFQKRLKKEDPGRNRAYWRGSKKPPLSENKTRGGTQASPSRFITVELSSKRQPLAEAKDGSQTRPQKDASGRQAVDVSGLNISPSSRPVPAIPNWSPELF